MRIDYSVVIRTTGKAKDKYQALLDSIEKLDPRPIEVIVVLPNGYELPEEQLGYEKFYFSPKGMVIQRMTGIEKCTTKYALICDDDVKFESDFVQKLYQPIKEGLCYLSAGPLYSFLPQKGFKALVSILTASAVPTVLHKKSRYVSVLKSTGYSYNRHLNQSKTTYYDTQSVAWTCFFADVNAIKKLEFDKETWLDSHGYSAMDDQTMFYKAWLNGYKTIVVSDAIYQHMDGKTSTSGNKTNVLYSAVYNRFVFWHRFIYSINTNGFGRFLSVVAFAYKRFGSWVMDCCDILRNRLSKEEKRIKKQAYKDVRDYIKSAEYNMLPKVIKERK